MPEMTLAGRMYDGWTLSDTECKHLHLHWVWYGYLNVICASSTQNRETTKMDIVFVRGQGLGLVVETGYF